MGIAKEIKEAVGKFRAHGVTRLDYAKSRFVVAAKSIFPGNRVQELEKETRQISSQILITLVFSVW
jgi:hypothetical protein